MSRRWPILIADGCLRSDSLPRGGQSVADAGVLRRLRLTTRSRDLFRTRVTGKTDSRTAWNSAICRCRRSSRG